MADSARPSIPPKEVNITDTCDGRAVISLDRLGSTHRNDIQPPVARAGREDDMPSNGLLVQPVMDLNMPIAGIERRAPPKLTAWRLVNSTVLLGFGTVKSVMAFQGKPSANDYDMALGLVWAFISYWFSVLEAESPGIAPWLFETEILGLESLAHVIIVALVVAAMYPILTLIIFVLGEMDNWPVVVCILVVVAILLASLLVVATSYLCFRKFYLALKRIQLPSYIDCVPLHWCDWNIVHQWKLIKRMLRQKPMITYTIFFSVLLLVSVVIRVGGPALLPGKFASSELEIARLLLMFAVFLYPCALYVGIGIGLTTIRIFKKWRGVGKGKQVARLGAAQAQSNIARLSAL